MRLSSQLWATRWPDWNIIRHQKLCKLVSTERKCKVWKWRILWMCTITVQWKQFSNFPSTYPSIISTSFCSTGLGKQELVSLGTGWEASYAADRLPNDVRADRYIHDCVQFKSHSNLNVFVLWEETYTVTGSMCKLHTLLSLPPLFIYFWGFWVKNVTIFGYFFSPTLIVK